MRTWNSALPSQHEPRGLCVQHELPKSIKAEPLEEPQYENSLNLGLVDDLRKGALNAHEDAEVVEAPSELIHSGI